MKKFDKLKLALLTIILAVGVNNVMAQCQASFTYTDNGNGVIVFVNTSSFPDSIATAFWDFGDGGYATGDNPAHTYADGWHSVCLTINDTTQGGSCSSTYCDSVFVDNSIDSLGSCDFVAGFTFADNGGGNYDFTNSSTGFGEVFIWNFGDGSTSMDYSPNHTFAANGVYVVVQGVSDSIGDCVEYFTTTITVTEVVNPAICNAGFTIYTDSTYNGVYVVNSSTGSNLNYFWDFGDGNTSTQAYPNYTYASAGPFSLCLTVSSDSACTSTYCDSIGAGGIVFKTGGFEVNVQSPVVTGVEDVNAGLFSGFNVYPNPVIGNLTIDLDLIKSTQVDVVVTDVLGNVIAEVVSAELSAGHNKLNWNSRGVSNGVYLLNIKAGNEFKVEKLVLNR